MLLRLLLAVLTVAGPCPVGVCTCVAASRPTVPPAPVAAESAPAKSCDCKHHAAEGVAAPAADNAGGCAEQPARHDRHTRDCPAAYPGSAPPAAPTPAADLPADSCLASPVPLDAPAHYRPDPLPGPAPPTIPLYLSLRALRI